MTNWYGWNKYYLKISKHEKGCTEAVSQSIKHLSTTRVINSRNVLFRKITNVYLHLNHIINCYFLEIALFIFFQIAWRSVRHAD